jgi:hypothetical protein
MKSLILLGSLLLAACATQNRAAAPDLKNTYIDCTNKQSFESYLNRQLSLTDMDKVLSDPVERQYYAAIKDRLWTLRSTCR